MVARYVVRHMYFSSLTHALCQLFGIMMKMSTKIDPHIQEAIRRLRDSGKFTLAALTNNFAPPTATDPTKGQRTPTLDEELEHLGLGQGTKMVRNLFDYYIESAVVGMR